MLNVGVLRAATDNTAIRPGNEIISNTRTDSEAESISLCEMWWWMHRILGGFDMRAGDFDWNDCLGVRMRYPGGVGICCEDDFLCTDGTSGCVYE
jgi:hypothetical protein